MGVGRLSPTFLWIRIPWRARRLGAWLGRGYGAHTVGLASGAHQLPDITIIAMSWIVSS